MSDQLKQPNLPASPVAGKAYTIQSAHVDVGLASVSLKNAQQRHTDGKAVLEDALSGVEDATPEAVAAQLLSPADPAPGQLSDDGHDGQDALVNYLG